MRVSLKYESVRKPYTLTIYWSRYSTSSTSTFSHIPHQLLTFPTLKKPSKLQPICSLCFRLLFFNAWRPLTIDDASALHGTAAWQVPQQQPQQQMQEGCVPPTLLFSSPAQKHHSKNNLIKPLSTTSLHRHQQHHLLPHRHHLNLQVLLLLPPILITPFHDQAHYSYATLSNALNRTATRVINKLTAWSFI